MCAECWPVCFLAVNVVGGFPGGERGLKIFVEEGDFLIADPQQGELAFGLGCFKDALRRSSLLLYWEVRGVSCCEYQLIVTLCSCCSKMPYGNEQACAQ